MNIFYLHQDPLECARQHCDKHVVKMAIEYAQLLSTTHRVVDGAPWAGRTTNGRRIIRYLHNDSTMNINLYKACHVNHPSTIWVRQSKQNYDWLYDMWIHVCNEYTHRYGRVHASMVKLEEILVLAPDRIGDGEFTEPTLAMKQYPNCVVKGDAVESYRNFYWEDKRGFAKWTNRPEPSWWQERELLNG